MCIGNLKKWYFAGADFRKLPRETQRYLQGYHKLTEEEDV